MISGHFIGDQVELDDKESLFSLLLGHDMKETPICLVNVAGTTRHGMASFLKTIERHFYLDSDPSWNAMEEEILASFLLEHEIAIMAKAIFINREEKHIGIMLMKKNVKLRNLLQLQPQDIPDIGDTVTGRILYERFCQLSSLPEDVSEALKVYRTEFARTLREREYLDDEELVRQDTRNRALSMNLLDPRSENFRPRVDSLSVQMSRQFAIIARVNDAFREMAQDESVPIEKAKKPDGLKRISSVLSSATKSFRDLFKSKEASRSIFYV